MKLIELSLNTVSTDPRNLTYRVDLQDNSGTYTPIHYGKIFVEASQDKVTLDLQDLLINYYFTGKQSIKPVLSTVNNQYEMPSDTAAVANEAYYNNIRVVSTDTPAVFTTVTKAFWFVPTDVFGYDSSMASGLNATATDTMVPHIPTNPPTGFNFSCLLYNNSNATINVTYKRDNTVVGTFSVAANKAYHRPLSGATGAYYMNDVKVASVDTCNKPYYLVWLQNNGGLQCQGFNKTSTFSVAYQNKTRVDNKNTEWNVTKTATGQWKLKSSNINEAEYRSYGEMFNSPFIVLLDMENGRLHYVNITSTDYQEKKRTRTDGKPLYFEVEVTSAEKLRV